MQSLLSFLILLMITVSCFNGVYEEGQHGMTHTANTRKRKKGRKSQKEAIIAGEEPSRCIVGTKPCWGDAKKHYQYVCCDMTDECRTKSPPYRIGAPYCHDIVAEQRAEREAMREKIQKRIDDEKEKLKKKTKRKSKLHSQRLIKKYQDQLDALTTSSPTTSPTQPPATRASALCNAIQQYVSVNHNRIRWVREGGVFHTRKGTAYLKYRVTIRFAGNPPLYHARGVPYYLEVHFHQDPHYDKIRVRRTNHGGPEICDPIEGGVGGPANLAWTQVPRVNRPRRNQIRANVMEDNYYVQYEYENYQNAETYRDKFQNNRMG
eukprot:528300_1